MLYLFIYLFIEFNSGTIKIELDKSVFGLFERICLRSVRNIKKKQIFIAPYVASGSEVHKNEIELFCVFTFRWSRVW